MKTNETKVGGPGAGVAEAAGERAKDCVDAGVSAYNAVSSKARQIAHGTNDYIRARPWWAIGAAAGAGILIGFLIPGLSLEKHYEYLDRS
jgi:ElaB/YqjD/DUF883 family membrane-anchored ribosome-binding protein